MLENDIYLNSLASDLDRQLSEIENKIIYYKEIHEIKEDDLIELIIKKNKIKNEKSRNSFKQKRKITKKV